jgi:Tfp pilus assembly protein PilX
MTRNVSSLSRLERVAAGRVRVCEQFGLAKSQRRGAALVLAMVTMLVVVMIAGALVQLMLANHRQGRHHHSELQAQWLAAAGMARARAQLEGQADYPGETWRAPVHEARGDEPSTGQVTIKIEADRQIVVEAIYPQDEIHRVLVRLESPGGSP